MKMLENELKKKIKKRKDARKTKFKKRKTLLQEVPTITCIFLYLDRYMST